LGNNAAVCNQNGNLVQYTYFHPYGKPVGNGESTGQTAQPYKFGGKEEETMMGLSQYDFEARTLDYGYNRFTTMDPLAEKYYNISPYAYCANNPVKYTDPTGLSPVYDPYGNLIGTDDTGLQGDAIIMDKDNFKQGMSYKDAMKHNLGVEGLSDQEATDKYTASFEGLKDRPDWDVYLTLGEANDWYQNGNGQPLFMALDKIDLSLLYSKGEKYVGEFKHVSLFNASNSINDALVYGTIGLTRYPNHQVKGTYDTYDFDMHESGGVTTWLRNRATEIGEWVAGEGAAYRIYFNGTKTLMPLWPWTK
jgi:RHS repeat-associated protein